MSGAVVVIRQNRFMAAFRNAGALSPATPVTLNEVRVRPGWVFRRLAARGVFVPVGQDLWYMSEPAAAAFVRRRFNVMLGLIAVGLIAFLIIMLVSR